MTDCASGQYDFVPRIINPLRLKRALFFAADAQVRDSRRVLEAKMPWLQTRVLPDPGTVMSCASDDPSVFLLDDTGLAFVDAKKLKAGNSNSVLVLLSFQPFIQCAPPQAAAQKYPYTASADLTFAVNRQEFLPERIIPSAVRAAEDLLNIRTHTNLRRFIFHVVDDEPRWFSEFLPVLYAIIGQRADVMITRTYEESLRFLFGTEDESKIGDGRSVSGGHGDDVVCLIADIFFPKGADLQRGAGGDLIRLVNRRYPRIPVIVASKAQEARRFQELGFLLPKGDPGSPEKLKEYILNFTGMGDFLICDERGHELRRARNIREIYEILLEAEKETQEGRRLRRILEDYGDKDKFSTWLYMHSYPELGDRLRPRRSRGRRLISLLKRNLQAEIRRLDRTPLSIADKKVFRLSDLLATLRLLSPEDIQPYSDNDCFSSWLDRQGYSELAEELRPVHGSGPGLSRTLIDIIEKWMAIYRERGVPV